MQIVIEKSEEAEIVRDCLQSRSETECCLQSQRVFELLQNAETREVCNE